VKNVFASVDRTKLRVLRLVQLGKGEPILGVPYEKLKVWIHLPLRDKRVKALTEKRVTKTFRFRPAVITRIKFLAEEAQSTETDVIEKLLLGKLTK
jgi:hypothetical protein